MFLYRKEMVKSVKLIKKIKLKYKNIRLLSTYK